MKLSVGLGSPAFWKLRSYTGTYRRVGQLNGAPYYRLQVKQPLLIAALSLLLLLLPAAVVKLVLLLPPLLLFLSLPVVISGCC